MLDLGLPFPVRHQPNRTYYHSQGDTGEVRFDKEYKSGFDKSPVHISGQSDEGGGVSGLEECPSLPGTEESDGRGPTSRCTVRVPSRLTPHLVDCLPTLLFTDSWTLSSYLLTYRTSCLSIIYPLTLSSIYLPIHLDTFLSIRPSPIYLPLIPRL